MPMLKIDQKKKRVRAHFDMSGAEINDYMNKKYIVSIKTKFGSITYYPRDDKYAIKEENGKET